MARSRALRLSPISRPARFVVVGGSNALVSFSVFTAALAVLPRLAGSAGVAQAVSYAAGILWSFTWNRGWTFADRPATAGAFGRFLALQLALLAASAAAVGLGTALLPAAAPQLVWLLVMIVVTVVNYVAQNRLVFAAQPANGWRSELGSPVGPSRIAAGGASNGRPVRTADCEAPSYGTARPLPRLSLARPTSAIRGGREPTIERRVDALAVVARSPAGRRSAAAERGRRPHRRRRR